MRQREKETERKKNVRNGCFDIYANDATERAGRKSF